MPQDTRQSSKDVYVHYEFVCVKCNDCGVESNPFVFKDHLNADETIEYILQITGFSENKSSGERLGNFVAGRSKSTEGGLLCPICNENKNGGLVVV